MSQQDQQHVTESVRYLWSSNDSERRAGIELILQIGPPAEDLLLKSLIELTRDQYPRFPKEIEEEGQRAVEEYLEAEREFEEDDSAVDYEVVLAKKDAVSKLAINARVMSDVVDLLGQLRAESSIPILIAIANRHWTVGISGPEARSPETEALTRLGKAAIPSLITNLDDASIRASGFEPIVYSWRIPIDYDDDSGSDYDDGEESIRQKINWIRHRTLMILGDIGDSAAVEPLERFLENIRQSSSPVSSACSIDDTLINTVELAISKIKKTGRFRPQDPTAPKLVSRP